MKFTQFIASFLILLFFPFFGCKPSQEEFSKLENRQTELEKKVKNLEDEINYIKPNIKYDPKSDGILELDPFITNLSDPDGKRYIKLAITIDFGSKKLLISSYHFINQIRDKIIYTLSNVSFNDMASIEGKIKLKNNLISDVNSIITPSEIDNLYFTDLVVQ